MAYCCPGETALAVYRPGDSSGRRWVDKVPDAEAAAGCDGLWVTEGWEAERASEAAEADQCKIANHWT